MRGPAGSRNSRTLLNSRPGLGRAITFPDLGLSSKSLLLPAASRAAVFAADRAAADSGYNPSDWIARFPNLVGEDGNSSPRIQTIFYPIPSAALRLRRLEKTYLRFVPGNLARNNLSYSWATLRLLGRAVHCNVGRPELWVFPPSA